MTSNVDNPKYSWPNSSETSDNNPNSHLSDDDLVILIIAAVDLHSTFNEGAGQDQRQSPIEFFMYQSFDDQPNLFLSIEQILKGVRNYGDEDTELAELQAEINKLIDSGQIEVSPTSNGNLYRLKDSQK